MKKLTTVITKKGNYFELLLPHIREVCSTCNGEGKHVNPSIDGNGLSPDAFHDDPDFAESYFSGRYDVTCDECKGERVVWVLDYDSLSAKNQERVERALIQNQRDEAEAAYERRMGA